MLYEKNKARELDDALFQNPTCEYRGAPFWAWNCKLTKETLEKQIEYLKEMGFGGFHMHSRTGMDTSYLSDEFMELIKNCVDKAEQEKMLAWLYDEDRWPSGAAGGLVTKDPKYRQRKLVFTVHPADAVNKEEAVQTGKPYLLACYDIVLSKAGELAQYEKIESEAAAKGTKWYAYIMTNESSPWYNNETYVDTLNPEAMNRFIEITYESYKKKIGKEFGKRAPAIFTDEPQFQRKSTLHFPEDKIDVTLPWTMNFPDTFSQAYGFDLIDHLPELIWDLPEQKVSYARYCYHDHVTERFTQAFADNCGGWCAQNNLMLTGHVMGEPTLLSQTHELGEAMRAYRGFQLPGIDMLCNWFEYTTAKQTQSAVHQFGREGMLSELYGVTNWNFDFRGHKFQGDWQAALGVTVRVPHLSWVSMGGEAKRDYPASINYQSPWYKEYSYVEDHFARVNTALTRGKPVVKVGVIHPIESYWLHWGPGATTLAVREQLESDFQNLTSWLLSGLMDFDFISESLLPELCPEGGNPLQVGQMQYDAVLVPGCQTLRKTTLERLTTFQKAGGKLIFAGECPGYIDAQPSEMVQALYHASLTVPMTKYHILNALEAQRMVDIRNTDGSRTINWIYQMRRDQTCSWLFLAHGSTKELHDDLSRPQAVQIRIKGEYTPVIYDTMTGKTMPAAYTCQEGDTLLDRVFYAHDSLLLKLLPFDGKPVEKAREIKALAARVVDFKTKLSYQREEPNVLLLDRAEYALDEEGFRPEEEILRLDNVLREQMGWPSKQEHVAQPWTYEAEQITHSITLRFTIESQVALEGVALALEDAEKAQIEWNGTQVPSVVTGWFTDEAIKTVALPQVKQGENVLVIRIPFGKTTNTEWCYLLGDFNVKLNGCVATLMEAEKEIGFGSITSQGMPFYGGNLVYEAQLQTPACDLVIRVPQYRGALVRVMVDGADAGRIVYDPYCVKVANLKEGPHKLSFLLYGNRYNSFGGLHNANGGERWCGPQFWRTQGDAWCYEYRLQDTGIMASPLVSIIEK